MPSARARAPDIRPFTYAPKPCSALVLPLEVEPALGHRAGFPLGYGVQTSARALALMGKTVISSGYIGTSKPRPGE